MRQMLLIWRLVYCTQLKTGTYFKHGLHVFDEKTHCRVPTRLFFFTWTAEHLEHQATVVATQKLMSMLCKLWNIKSVALKVLTTTIKLVTFLIVDNQKIDHIINSIPDFYKEWLWYISIKKPYILRTMFQVLTLCKRTYYALSILHTISPNMNGISCIAFLYKCCRLGTR